MNENSTYEIFKANSERKQKAWKLLATLERYIKKTRSFKVYVTVVPNFTIHRVIRVPQLLEQAECAIILLFRLMLWSMMLTLNLDLIYSY